MNPTPNCLDQLAIVSIIGSSCSAFFIAFDRSLSHRGVCTFHISARLGSPVRLLHLLTLIVSFTGTPREEVPKQIPSDTAL